MFKPRPCGCKGIRTCLICEQEFGVVQKIGKDSDSLIAEANTYEFCYLCQDKAWRGQGVAETHPDHVGESVSFPGVFIKPNFLTEEEETRLVEGCDGIPWDSSQSGRRKQNFGPKTNFKKMKLKETGFDGFPKFSQFVQEKLMEEKLLQDFQTIEQCAIEYRVETGACIDPHIDDCWVWGERVISVNLLSDSVLTMTKYQGTSERYNLKFHKNVNASDESGNQEYPIVRIPMPRRSLLVLYGPARYEWEHSILRDDIGSRRICLAYREFTPEYLPGGKFYEPLAQSIIEQAKHFW